MNPPRDDAGFGLVFVIMGAVMCAYFGWWIPLAVFVFILVLVVLAVT